MLFKNLHWKEKLWKIPVRFFLDAVFAWKRLLQGDSVSYIAIVKAHAAVIGWFFTSKNKQALHEIPMKKMDTVYAGSIVWAYFMKKKKRFSEIVYKNL